MTHGDSEASGVNRRRFLKGATGAVGAGMFAGCLGGNGGGDGDWPPPRNIVELANDSEPGGLIDVLARLWQPYYQDCLEEDVSLAISNEPEAGGVPMANRIYNDESTYGGVMGSMRAISLIANQIGRDDANYATRELRHVVRFSADTRGLQMNPRTTPVEDHFDITWEEFQDFATSQDDPLIQPLSNPAHTVLGLFLYGNDPKIEIGEHIEMVNVSGGSEARSAMARGDADLYFGSYVSNITTRNEFYFTQFSMVDPEADPEFYNSIKDVTPETSPEFGDNPVEKTLAKYVDQAAIVNTSYPNDVAKKVVGLVSDHHISFLPPPTSDEAYDIQAEAWGCAADSDDLAADVADQFAPPDHNPLAGEAVQQIVEDKFATLSEDDEIRTLIEEELF